MTAQAVNGSLVAFPAAGGGVWMFAALRRQIPAGLKLVVPDLPGRGKRARCGLVLDIFQLVAELCDEVTEQVSGRPYAVFGSCFGSLIGFELVREIRRRNLRLPQAFLVSARQPPDTAPSYAHLLGRTDEQLRAYLQRNRPIDRSNRGAVQLQDLLLKQLRTDIRIGASHNYAAEAPLSMPIYAYHGASGIDEKAEDLATSAEGLDHWRAHTTGSFRLDVVPGGRDFYMTDPSRLVADLVAVL